MTRGAVPRHRRPGLHRRVDRPRARARGRAGRRLRPRPRSRAGSAQIVEPDELERVDVRRRATSPTSRRSNGPSTSTASRTSSTSPRCRCRSAVPTRRSAPRSTSSGPSTSSRRSSGAASRMAPVVYTGSIGDVLAVRRRPDDGPARGGRRRPSRATTTASTSSRTRATARIYWARLRRRQRRPPADDGLRRRPRPGHDEQPDRRDRGGGAGRAVRDRFGGPTLFQYAEDVARTLLLASRLRAGRGARLQPRRRRGRDRRLGRRDRERRPRGGRPDHGRATELPFPAEIAHDSLAELGDVPVTPYRDGIAATADIYRRLPPKAGSSGPNRACPRRSPPPEAPGASVAGR